MFSKYNATGLFFIVLLKDNAKTAIFQASYSDQPSGEAVQHCRLCEAGWFCSRAGLTEPEGLCDPGHYCASGASTGSPVSHTKAA